VFIYLTPEARRTALGNLARLLRPDGLFCTSVTEAMPIAEQRFVRWGPPAYGLYRRVVERPSSHEMPTVAVPPVSSPSAPPLPPVVPAAPVARPSSLLEDARRLANLGRLDDALAACMAIETAHGPSADLFTLLGVIHQGRGDEHLARDAFRKALYLEANHREALTHLALLTPHGSDSAGARGMQRRLSRLGPATPDSEEPA
jgi:chemotaxis protein methyltransferase WspC